MDRTHPGGFEPPTPGSVGQCSIQLSYGCEWERGETEAGHQMGARKRGRIVLAALQLSTTHTENHSHGATERKGFEPPVRLPVHMISNHAPSTTRPPLPVTVARPRHPETQQAPRARGRSKQQAPRARADRSSRPRERGADRSSRPRERGADRNGPVEAGPTARRVSLAENVGFEPTEPLRVRLISNQVPSTTRPALRGRS